MKMELRQIKNGFLVNIDGVETYYETADQATRHILPLIQGLLTDWQKSRDRGKVSMAFELLRMA